MAFVNVRSRDCRRQGSNDDEDITEKKCIVCDSGDLLWDLIILKEMVGRRLALMC
jgi:hypothetical protein